MNDDKSENRLILCIARNVLKCPLYQIELALYLFELMNMIEQ